MLLLFCGLIVESFVISSPTSTWTAVVTHPVESTLEKSAVAVPALMLSTAVSLADAVLGTITAAKPLTTSATKRASKYEESLCFITLSIQLDIWRAT
jgi:hypothetical protein